MRRVQVVILCAVARVAAAGPSVGVVVTGEPALQSKVRAQTSVWLQQHGFTVAAKPLSSDGLKTLSNCFVVEDMACARGVVEHQSTADFLVFVRADLVGGKRSREANLVAYWFLKDRDAVVDKRNCKPCANAMLAQTTKELIGSVYDQTALAKARLKIADPPGVIVMLDGVNVGVTPMEQDVSPGKHDISLQHDDKTLGTVSIETKAGDIRDVRVPIVSPDVVIVKQGPTKTVIVQKDAPVPLERESPSRILPGLLIVAGVGAIAAGGVAIYYGHKNGPNDPLIYPSANRDGAIIAGVGGVALITGLVLWWHGTASQNGPTASLTPGGTIIGWAGNF